MLKKVKLYLCCLCVVGCYLALPYFLINTQAFFQLPISNLAHKFNFREFTFLAIEIIPPKGPK